MSTVLDPSGTLAETDWAAGLPYYRYDDVAAEWRLQPGAPDPAQVITFSRGNDAQYDDSIEVQEWDALVDAYGVSATVAAGNSGPAPQTINDPALAYNVIGVGAFSGGGTTTPLDDTVFGWSSRGPTVAGRKKPDIVAVGDGGLADSYYQTTGSLWKYDTGTSYSAPQVGAGAILLAGAGIRDPKLVKAILIDSARSGRATSASPMGTQTGWLPDWGWGEMNLDAAYSERLNFARDDIPSNGARFFRATTQASGDRATLVWNRRVADCQPLRQGCYYDTDSGFRVYTLSNLDLTEYDATSGTQRNSSTSSVDNVEQVRTPGAANVVYKVSTGAVDGPAGEPFAIAATRPVTPLTTPQPTTSITIGATGPLKAGEQATVTADIANPSPDLTAEYARVTLDLPAGVELLSGEVAQSLGTLARNGSPGDRATATWTVRAATGGIKALAATTTAARYGSTFRSSATGQLAVAATPAPATPSPTVFPPTPGGSLAGGGTASPPTLIPTPSIGSRPPAKQSPQLKITSVTRVGSRLRVRGSVARGANGQLTAQLTARIRRARRRITRASSYAQLRRFMLPLKVPLKAKGIALTVTYRGDGSFVRQTVRRTIRAH